MDIKTKLVKEIIYWCGENLTLDTSIHLNNLEFKGYTQDQVKYHVIQLIEGGYIDSVGYEPHDYRSVSILKLTWEGHEYLNLLKSDTVGKRVLEICDKLGVKPFPMLLEVLKAYFPSILASLS